MKNNRLTTRVMAVIAAVLLITALSVPAFAATSYSFTVDESGAYPIHIYAGELPEGSYYLEVGDMRTSVPIDVVYVIDDGVPFCTVQGTFEFDSFSQNATINIGVISADRTIVEVKVNGQSAPFEGLTFVSADSDTVHLTDYITAETLPSVYNEIISLLPVTLGVVVGFIAIRKGISFLQSFLRNS